MKQDAKTSYYAVAEKVFGAAREAKPPLLAVAERRLASDQ
jgi:hypothetical protein